MEILFWLVALYFVGRRWLRKNPDKAAALKKVLQESQSHKRTELLKAVARPVESKPQQPTATAAGTHKPQPVLTQRKKAEKQFQEL